jgi:hypothetical protein
MTSNRKDLKVTRLDLRIPNDIYSQVEEIAKANNEPSHHITGNIVLSPTLLKLISLGIRSLSGNYSGLADTPINIVQVSDTLSPRVSTIEEELAELKKVVAELSGKLSATLSDDILTSDIVPDKLSDNNNPLPDRVSDSDNTLSDSMTDKVPDKFMQSIVIPPSLTIVEGDSKSWIEFFKMVSIEALTATEAQKKENIDIRTKQIARGIQVAKEKGLGKWAVKVAGRSFVRVPG